ncbi:MAG: hypothetical protein ACJ74O_18210 [Frankiaceae bacterium]
MATLLQPAYPYVTVVIDTSALLPSARRAPGVVAVVGLADDAAAEPANAPVEVTDHDSIMASFANGTAANPLTESLDLVLAQDPRPSKVYGVRTDAGKDYAAALAGLEAADDVTFVCLASEFAPGGGGNSPTKLMALRAHVEQMSAAGQKRMGVAAIDPAIAKGTTYAADQLAGGAYGKLMSDDGRMILVAARGATTDPGNPAATADAAAAAMGAIAGYSPSTSVVLKQVRGFTMPVTGQYAPAEVNALAGAGVIPLIDPALIPGTGLYFADGGTFSSDATRNYVDIVRVLDDIEFRLRAGLIGTVGDSRITKPGLTSIRVRIEGILGPLQQAAVIDDYSVSIPVLDILGIPESARSPADEAQVVTARSTRQVDVRISITYGPAVHRLNVTLAPKF